MLCQSIKIKPAFLSYDFSNRGHGQRCKFFPLAIVFFLGMVAILPDHAKAQSIADYDEVSVSLNVQRIGGIEIPILIRGQSAYLPIAAIFNYLRIKNTLSAGKDSVSGFFIHPQSIFLIDKTHNNILYNGKKFPVKPGDLISTFSDLYLSSNYFGPIFGLDCTFNFRNLSVNLTTVLDLPVFRDMRLELMRSNISKLKGEFKSDTVIAQSLPIFRVGMADYSVVSELGALGNDARLSVGLGGVIAGGETNVFLNYNTNERFNEQQQNYLWRLVNNDNTLIKQISVGKVNAPAIASIYAPIIGVQVTNAPSTYRKSFGTYTLSNRTEPNWLVELYVNNILISYIKADAVGFYSFSVPLVYGVSIIKLRFYGPYGEERSSEQNILIPFKFLPQNEFEYTATAGIVDNVNSGFYSRFSSNYGLTKKITIGGGMEYLSSISTRKEIPFFDASVRVLPNLLFYGEYDFGVKSKAGLSYNLPSGLQLEVNDTWYTRGQTAINNLYIEDRNIILSFPFKANGFAAYSRLTIEQILLPFNTYTKAEWLISGIFGKFISSLNNYALLLNKGNPYVYSQLSISTRIFKNISVTQQIQYEYAKNKIADAKTVFEKRILKNGYLDISYERNFSSNINNYELGLRYNFAAFQTKSTFRKSNQALGYFESINGSLIYDDQSGHTFFDSKTSVGKAAITLIPYLDLNGNNRHDADEPGAPGLKVTVNSGRLALSTDTTFRITGVIPYENINIELDGSGFDEISWQLPKKKYLVKCRPNFVERIYIPVLVLGLVSGRVITDDNGTKTGTGRISIQFFDNNRMVASTVSEVDGYFTYLGLMPGTYTARINPIQLAKMHSTAHPVLANFEIKRNIEGSVVDNIVFVLKTDLK
ncbi:hypothetical protein A0256_01080 [Mucilaginibacter sp. PAMC 26640]|nr:hypothetical protein A0256_01080 [Mucilaginibacter sp. PAMC 26640]